MPEYWYELDSGGDFTVAGWQADGSAWHDVEKRDTPWEQSGYSMGDMEIVVFHYSDQGGNDLYFTLYGPWDDLDSLADLIEDCLDRYGVE